MVVVVVAFNVGADLIYFLLTDDPCEILAFFFYFNKVFKKLKINHSLKWTQLIQTAHSKIETKIIRKNPMDQIHFRRPYTLMDIDSNFDS